MDKSRDIVTAAATVVGCVFAVVAYFKPWQTTPASVSASGGAIAAGHDVKIGERQVVESHDFDGDRKQEVNQYLDLALTKCREHSMMIASLTTASAISITDPTAMVMQVQRPEMVPPEIVAEHFGEEVYAGIKARFSRAVQSSQGVTKVLFANAGAAMGGKSAAHDAEAFEQDKNTWMQSTNELCAYFKSLRETGSPL